MQSYQVTIYAGLKIIYSTARARNTAHAFEVALRNEGLREADVDWAGVRA